VPESGDTVQAMKAGLMEIGDVFVINKADREGAERAAFAVRSALELRTPVSDWEPPVLLTVASQDTGVTEVVAQLEAHFEYLRSRGGLDRRRRERLEQRLEDLLRAQLWGEFTGRVPDAVRREVVDGMAARKLSPRQAVERLIETRDERVRRTRSKS